MTALIFLLALLGTLFVFATTRPGREIGKRIGLRDHVPGAASSDSVEFLRSACEGDRAEVERRLAIERERYPDLTEQEHYRRAIRKRLAERGR